MNNTAIGQFFENPKEQQATNKAMKTEKLIAWEKCFVQQLKDEAARERYPVKYNHVVFKRPECVGFRGNLV